MPKKQTAFDPWQAQVAELVDALASGASGQYGRGSSSLLLGTIFSFDFV